MKRVAQIISWIALAGVIAPPLAYLSGHLALDSVKTWMLVFTIVWFASTPIWMGRIRHSR